MLPNLVLTIGNRGRWTEARMCILNVPECQLSVSCIDVQYCIMGMMSE